ncbi:hypothetical protein [Candidatus Mycoplasma haematohominis]|uniref:Uncharacterized protein n=1 Tax=Candidatus Mycoplasma haematohominis TaxID=1494318 RepID=A0A478FRM7_9MOLU|nr:hypothetical protein [Candidatus Mycoplasma haemohominis]GCE63714.1 hypothetical protein MHSWG343_07140 [Candidatus Mycoplasma haemohominis]
MSTQAIGAAAAGTAILGGGGATIAYAAGAFDGNKSSTPKTYVDFDDYVKNGGKYKYIGQGDNVVDADPTQEKIKGLLSGSEKETYKENLKGQWEGMNLGSEDNTSRPSKKELEDSIQAGKDTEKDKVSLFVNKWCIQNKKQKPTSTGAEKRFTEQEMENYSEWFKFEKACLETVSSNQ